MLRLVKGWWPSGLVEQLANSFEMFLLSMLRGRVRTKSIYCRLAYCSPSATPFGSLHRAWWPYLLPIGFRHRKRWQFLLPIGCHQKNEVAISTPDRLTPQNETLHALRAFLPSSVIPCSVTSRIHGATSVAPGPPSEIPRSTSVIPTGIPAVASELFEGVLSAFS